LIKKPSEPAQDPADDRSQPVRLARDNVSTTAHSCKLSDARRSAGPWRRIVNVFQIAALIPAKFPHSPEWFFTVVDYPALFSTKTLQLME
jgi:hypothetical protein